MFSVPTQHHVSPNTARLWAQQTDRWRSGGRSQRLRQATDLSATQRLRHLRRTKSQLTPWLLDRFTRLPWQPLALRDLKVTASPALIQQVRRDFSYYIPRSHWYCLSLSLCGITGRLLHGCIQAWPNQHSVGYTTTTRDRGISVLNNCLEWDKFVRLALTYPTPDSCLTYTSTVHKLTEPLSDGAPYYTLWVNKNVDTIPSSYLHQMWPILKILSLSPYLTLPYLRGGCTRHTSAEASIWAQCATPTDLIVGKIS